MSAAAIVAVVVCAVLFATGMPLYIAFGLGGKDKAKEFLVIMKSDEKLFEKLSKTIKELHSYDIPEILALPIVKGWTKYLDWLNTTLLLAER